MKGILQSLSTTSCPKELKLAEAYVAENYGDEPPVSARKMLEEMRIFEAWIRRDLRQIQDWLQDFCSRSEL